MAAITLKEALAQLKSLGDKKVRALHWKAGAADNVFGVKMGDIRKVAAKIKTDHKLALALWETGNIDAIERELSRADPVEQWTMNNCLAGIGVHHQKHRKRALAIGEKLGVYRDYPVSRGCTSPFAPIWINEMVRREA